MADPNRVAKIFRALSHPNRLRIYLELLKRDETTLEVGRGCHLIDIVRCLKIGSPTISHHVKELETAASCSARVGVQEMPDRVRWIRSYVLREDDGRLGTVCIYQATDPDAIREHARRAGLPVDEVTLAVRTAVLQEDPQEIAELA